MQKMFFFIVLFCLPVLAQSKLFSLDKLELKCQLHPWADELYLTVRGKAHTELKGGFLTVSLFYEKNSILTFRVPFKKGKTRSHLFFYRKMGPLNQPMQEVLPGKYLIKVEILKHQQKRSISSKLAQIKKERIFEQKIFFVKDNQSRLVEIQNAQRFYLNQMKILYNLLLEFHKNKKIALATLQNPKVDTKQIFSDQGKFFIKKWQAFLSRYLKKVKQSQQAIQKHQQQIFPLLYATTFSNMKEYCKRLKSMAKSYNKDYFTRAKKTNIATIERNKLIKFFRYLNNLHLQIQEEMQMSLPKELPFARR